ncbi:MAG: CHAT domain-containing protein [Cyanobacteriota bacterium]
MTKLVLLRLDGNLASGVQVGLEVGEDGKQPELESSGRLPPQPRLLEYFTYWQYCYRQLPVPTRLRPKQVSYSDSVWSCIQACQTAADYLQRAMSNWLAAREFRSIKEDLLCELKRNDTVRVLIHTRDPLLAQLPWHLWDFFERYPNTELAFSSPAAQRTRPVWAALPSGRVRILAILGNSAGIDVATDRALLAQLPQAAVRFLVEPSRQDICDRLFEQTWDILFFAGHSESVEGATAGDRGRMFINQTDSLAIADLRASLDKAVQRGLKLAILNSCNGLGLAQDLRPLHIPQLIVMREPVPDRIAQEFLKYFLSAFARGTSLYLSVREARQRLTELERDFPCASWLPVIFQNRAEMPPSWAGLLGSEGLVWPALPQQLPPDQADDALPRQPSPHNIQHEGRYREQARQWRESLSPSLQPERRSPLAIAPPETHLLPLAEAFSHPRQISPAETLWDASIPGSTPGNPKWRTPSSTHLDALPPSTTAMQNLSQPAAQPDQPTPPVARPAAPSPQPAAPVSMPTAPPAATVPTAPERTTPEYSAPQTDPDSAGAKPAPGVEATPAPLNWLPEEVLPISDVLGVGLVSDQGIVKEAIYPGYTGWVMHEGTRWKACLDLPWRQLYLPVDTPVRVLGRLDGTNILVVQPMRVAE